jgi:hypothetical protein
MLKCSCAIGSVSRDAQFDWYGISPHAVVNEYVMHQARGIRPLFRKDNVCCVISSPTLAELLVRLQRPDPNTLRPVALGSKIRSWDACHSWRGSSFYVVYHSQLLVMQMEIIDGGHQQ